MNRIYLLLLAVTAPIWAGITVLEQSPGMIRVKLTADPIVDRGTGDSIALGTFADVAASDSRGREIPALALSIFTQHPEKATVTVTTTKKAVITYGRPLRRADSSAVVINGISSPIQTSIYRHSPLHTWLITPVLFAENGMIEQFVEAEAVIRYVPVGSTARPDGDYERAVASMALNPREFYRSKPSYSRALSSDQLWISPSESVLRFTVGGKAGSEQETADGLDRFLKITPAMLSTGGLGSNFSMNEVAVYATNPSIHDSTTPPIDQLPSSLNRIPLILRDVNSNGIFDGSDEILFFAMGTNSWQRKNGRWEYTYNDFSEKRHFYIARGTGTPASKVAIPLAGTTPLTNGMQLHAVRQSAMLGTNLDEREHSSRKWIWQSLRKGSEQFTISSPFPIISVAPGTSPQLQLKIGVKDLDNSVQGRFRIYPSNDTVTALPASYSFDSKWVTLPASAERFSYETAGLKNENGKTQYLDIRGYDLRYNIPLNLSGKKYLRFYSNDTLSAPSLVTYEVNNLPAEFTAICRINARNQTVELVDTISTGGTFRWSDSVAVGYQYVIATASGATMPTLTLENGSATAPRTYQVTDLHASTNQSDYMIVTAPEFLDEAVRLASHKVAIGKFSHPTIVTTTDIYREFSGGTATPSAIRNFMVYVMNQWVGGITPSYLILLGTGHYDYKGILSSAPNFIPPFIDHNDIAVEDFFGYTTPRTLPGHRVPSLAVGRVPAQNRSELSAYLDKLILMEGTTGDYSEWRNQVALVSDDDFQEGGPEKQDIRHWESSDLCGDTILSVAPTVNLKKINLFEYPVEGLKKTAARDGFVNLLNDGVALANYFGHGSPTRMADEYLFDISDVGTLKNYQRYLIFSAFSCSVAFFDMPATPSLAGRMVTEAEKGAVASIASVRVSYASSNTNFGRTFFRNFFQPTTTSIGSAYITAKRDYNLETYAIFGDPSYRPISDNESIKPSVTLANGTATDTIRGAQMVYVKAALPAGESVDSVRVHLQMPTQKGVTRKDGWIGRENWPYSLPGKMIRNKVSAVTGDSILVRLDIPPFASGKIEKMQIRLYGWKKGQSKTVTGLTTVTYDGVDASLIDTTDKIGPSVAARLYHDESLTDTTLPGVIGNKITIDGFPKNDTDLVAKPVTVELFFRDSSGIDVTGDQAGEGITVAVPGIRGTKSHNGDFREIQEDPDQGRVLLYFREDEFPQPGEYEMTVTAGDYLKNRTQSKFILDVKSLANSMYDIGDFYAYPSPAHLGETTRFYFNAPQGNVHRMTLKIFTLSGQLIRQFNDVRPGVAWDLTDQAGNRLSPNVYLYRLYVERDGRPEVNAINSKGEKEIIRSEIRKMAIYPPR